MSSLLVVIDYGLILIFFICFTGLLLWGIYSRPRQVAASTIAPSQHESLTAYILLAGLFLLFIVLTVFTQKMGKQNNTFG